MMITADRLREVLSYDPETGIFTNKVRRNGTGGIGSVAGYKNKRGYILIGIDGRSYLAHRLAHLYMTGEWPSAEIDHKDRDCSNTRWTNLRPATRLQNARNRGINCNSRTGVTGVRWNKKAHKWLVQIQVNGETIYLGLFSHFEDAVDIRRIAELHLHGEFAQRHAA